MLKKFVDKDKDKDKDKDRERERDREKDEREREKSGADKERSYHKSFLKSQKMKSMNNWMRGKNAKKDKTSNAVTTQETFSEV